MIIRSPAWRWFLTVCVPCVALFMVGRQVYLNTRYGLSTWKGGGMGMFAAADELANRYAKIFLVDPNGDKNPLVRLSAEDNDILNRALEFPTRERFLRAGREIAQENWIPAFQPRPVLKVNGNGDPVEITDKSYRQLVPSSLRPNEKMKARGMEIQFWKITYDPHARVEHAVLAETFSFSPQELYNPKALFRAPTMPPDS